jgi:glycine cleavage system H protein
MALSYPEDLRYLDSHEYIQLEGDVATVGVTAFAIDQLGDIVFLELPEVGTLVSKGQGCGTIESVKAVEELYAPVDGEVLERNESLLEAPERLQEDPYEDGWLLKVRVSGDALADTLDAAAYQALVEGA